MNVKKKTVFAAIAVLAVILCTLFTAGGAAYAAGERTLTANTLGSEKPDVEVSGVFDATASLVATSTDKDDELVEMLISRKMINSASQFVKEYKVSVIANEAESDYYTITIKSVDTSFIASYGAAVVDSKGNYVKLKGVDVSRGVITLKTDTLGTVAITKNYTTFIIVVSCVAAVIIFIIVLKAIERARYKELKNEYRAKPTPKKW